MSGAASRLGRLRRLFADLGTRVALLYLLAKVLPLRFEVSLRHPRARFPLRARLGTTDLFVYRQIFCDAEYACLDDLDGPGLLLDGGANVGYSSAWFLSRFPGLSAVAVEPDPGNFALLEKNLAPYAGRVTLHRAAVWPRRAGLKISEVPFRGGLEWSVTVRPVRDGEEPGLRGVPVGDFLEGTPFARVSLLKLDIEGAEREVFADGAAAWIPRVDAMAIEIHDDAARDAVEAAVEGEGFRVSRSGELTVYRR